MSVCCLLRYSLTCRDVRGESVLNRSVRVSCMAPPLTEDFVVAISPEQVFVLDRQKKDLARGVVKRNEGIPEGFDETQLLLRIRCAAAPLHALKSHTMKGSRLPASSERLQLLGSCLSLPLGALLSCMRASCLGLGPSPGSSLGQRCLNWHGCLYRRDGLYLDRREDIPDVEAMVREAEAAGAQLLPKLACGNLGGLRLACTLLACS